MSEWKIVYDPRAIDDLKKLDGSQVVMVRKAIGKVATNPLPYTEGGLGKPLGNHANSALSGLLKIKLKKLGIRVVYKLVRTKEQMYILVIGMRCDDEVYEEAQKRYQE